jgi:hypothetical protein
MRTENVKVFLSVHEEANELMFHIRVEEFHFQGEYYNLREEPIVSVTKRVPKQKRERETLSALFASVRSSLEGLDLGDYCLDDVEDNDMFGLLLRDNGRRGAYVIDEGDDAPLYGKLSHALYERMCQKKVLFASEDAETEGLLRAVNWLYARQHQCYYEDGALEMTEKKFNRYSKSLDKDLLEELKELATFDEDFSSFKLKEKSPLTTDFYLFAPANGFILEK